MHQITYEYGMLCAYNRAGYCLLPEHSIFAVAIAMFLLQTLPYMAFLRILKHLSEVVN